jgi:DNA-binding transcriptional MerR regulator
MADDDRPDPRVRAGSSAINPSRGVYGISVAAELVGIDPQSLRLYERRGLLEPARTAGGTRRYSSDDIDRLRRVADLLAAGLNLAGIALVLHLQDDNADLRPPSNRTNPNHPESAGHVVFDV